MDVLLRLGPECNQRCLFCNVPTCKKYSTKQAISWIRNIDSDIKELSLTGGEPMPRKDIFSLVSEASNNKFVKKLTLQTNATIAFYSKTVRKLKENGLQHAFVAFHSHDEKVSNRLTSSTLWKKTVVGINHFLG